MRIVPKLSLALVAGTCAVLVVNGVFRVRREIAFFQADRARNHETIGRSIGVAVSATWKSEGRGAALAEVESFRRDAKRIDVRWHDAPPVAENFAGEPITTLQQGGHGREWHTWVPVDVGGTREGAIELVEPASGEERFARSTEIDTVVSVAVIVLFSTVLSLALGHWFVGRPVGALASKARRVGGGDFAGPVVLAQRDELWDLATEMNAMSDNLAATLAQLRHADRLATVGKLASGVAHELGTPLNVVHVRATMIAAEPGSAETHESAAAIVRATERMTKIIRQLLQFARAKHVTKARCDVYDLCRESADLLSPLASRKNARIETTRACKDAKLDVDAGAIQQVVTNLLMNALQAMPSGGEVKLAVRDDVAQPPADVGGPLRPCIRIDIADTGSGIAGADLQRIFEPFFTTKEVGEGTGLGLAVSYGIVREHGGWIDVDSAVGHGTTFRTYLPRQT